MPFIGWPLGLLLSACSSVFGILGKLALKLAHNQRELEEDEEERRLAAGTGSNHVGTASGKMWLMYFYAGLLSMLVLNPALGAVAYCFASQSLLAPMAGLTIVWNTLLGPVVLPHEQLTTSDLVGAVLIFSGCVLVGISGTHDQVPIPVDKMGDRFLSASFLLYTFALVGLLAVLIYYVIPGLVFVREGSSMKRGRQVSSGGSPGRFMGIDVPQSSRVSMSVLAGVLGGQLFFLAAIMRLLHDDAGTRIWTYSVTYVSIFGAISTGVLGLYVLNVALKLEDAVVVIYLYEASYIISGAISGLCFFQDMSAMTAWHHVVYGLSLLLILVGIYIVAHRPDRADLETSDKDHLLPLLVPSAATDHHESSRRGSAYYASRRSASPRSQIKPPSPQPRRQSLPFAVPAALF